MRQLSSVEDWKGQSGGEGLGGLGSSMGAVDVSIESQVRSDIGLSSSLKVIVGLGVMSRVRGQLQLFLNNTWSSVVLTIRDRHGHGAWRKRSASNVTASQGAAA
jgi:hypothetical protein